MTRLRPLLLVSLLGIVALAGCTQRTPDAPSPPVEAPAVYAPHVQVQVANVMAFAASVVKPAVGLQADLYEPTMEVSGTGTIYVTAHVAGAATTGSPAWFSRDNGTSWQVLPLLGPAAVPAPVQGSTPPPGDEGFIVAGDGDQAWMADIYAAGFSVDGWCGDGASQCYDNRYAYDRSETAQASCNAEGSLNDRPWAAFGNGTLLLVNNPGGGPMQLGVLKVPPAAPAGLFDPVTGPTWNLCASPGGYIPGVPAMRKDGFFAVPQMENFGAKNQYLFVVTGNANDIFKVEAHKVFNAADTTVAGVSPDSGTINGGRTAFDGAGTLYVGARNNTKAAKDASHPGQFVLAASRDNGATFVNVTFATAHPVRTLYLDSNLAGPAALLTWSEYGNDTDHSDWYVAHVSTGAFGEPVLSDVSLAVDEGPNSSAHVMGASAGPDGRAYFVTFTDTPGFGYVGSTPLTVWIQGAGPRLPVTAAVPAQ